MEAEFVFQGVIKCFNISIRACQPFGFTAQEGWVQMVNKQSNLPQNNANINLQIQWFEFSQC